MDREKSFTSRDDMKQYLVENDIQYLFEVSKTEAEQKAEWSKSWMGPRAEKQKNITFID